MPTARNEPLGGIVDGVNLNLTLAHIPLDNTQVAIFSSGARLTPGVHYNIGSGTTAVVFVAGYAPLDRPVADYDWGNGPTLPGNTSYASVADIRAQGLTDAATYPDAQVQAALNQWASYIDSVTGQFFEQRTLTALFDGTDTDTIFLPVALYSLTKFFMNGRFNDPSDLVDPTRYTVYSAQSLTDDRRNPRIKLNTANLDFFQMAAFGSNGRGFIKGNQNQKVVGVWGFVESDGSTPQLIKRALLKLVLRNVDTLAPGSVPIVGGQKGMVISEMTDGHQVMYQPPKRLNPQTLITGDPEVDTILKMYKAPLRIRATGTVFYQGQS